MPGVGVSLKKEIPTLHSCFHLLKCVGKDKNIRQKLLAMKKNKHVRRKQKKSFQSRHSQTQSIVTREDIFSHVSFLVILAVHSRLRPDEYEHTLCVFNLLETLLYVRPVCINAYALTLLT